MENRCVVAIVRSDMLELLERTLGAIHIHGLTVSKVKGFGKHPNVFADDWTTEHIKIEIFTEDKNVEALINEITSIACTCSSGEGVVAIFPVERFFHLTAQSET